MSSSVSYSRGSFEFPRWVRNMVDEIVPFDESPGGSASSSPQTVQERDSEEFTLSDSDEESKTVKRHHAVRRHSRSGMMTSSSSSDEESRISFSDLREISKLPSEQEICVKIPGILFCDGPDGNEREFGLPRSGKKMESCKARWLEKNLPEATDSKYIQNPQQKLAQLIGRKALYILASVQVRGREGAHSVVEKEKREIDDLFDLVEGSANRGIVQAIISRVEGVFLS